MRRPCRALCPTLFTIVLAVSLAGAGCKSENRRVADQLRDQVLTPLQRAKEGASKEEQENWCLAATMVAEAPRIAAQVRVEGSRAHLVMEEILEECRGLLNAPEFVMDEIRRDEQERDDRAVAEAEEALRAAEEAAIRAQEEIEAAEEAAAAAAAQQDEEETDDEAPDDEETDTEEE